MGTKRDAILLALENLTPDELKKFKLKLGAAQLHKGYYRIPRGNLWQMDAVDLTDQLVAHYCEDYAVELTVLLLQEMGMQQEASALQAE
ncbi:pyrin domain-containing protein 1 [Sorex fumeus]|uniref:pyrin domain-containing protein 1 n=1 Tax=Sorex fumeus TaxID=62283 RepID=UPI0024AD1AD0|nr:pyrin domain-containing protein 1 [Sorex fumeus]